MAKYTDGALVVEAEQFFPASLPWPAGIFEVEPSGDPYQDRDRYCADTAHGTVYIQPGDWLVSETKGKCYVVHAKLFAQMYVPIGEVVR